MAGCLFVWQKKLCLCLARFRVGGCFDLYSFQCLSASLASISPGISLWRYLCLKEYPQIWFSFSLIFPTSVLLWGRQDARCSLPPPTPCLPRDASPAFACHRAIRATRGTTGGLAYHIPNGCLVRERQEQQGTTTNTPNNRRKGGQLEAAPAVVEKPRNTCLLPLQDLGS